jgi:hypothetical protein
LTILHVVRFAAVHLDERLRHFPVSACQRHFAALPTNLLGTIPTPFPAHVKPAV